MRLHSVYRNMQTCSYRIDGSSPTCTTCSGISTWRSASSEICTKPSIPSCTRINAPNGTSFVTTPGTTVLIVCVRANACHGSSCVALSESETRSRSKSTSRTSTVTSSPTSTTSYSVTVTNPTTNCSASVSASATVNPLPIPTISFAETSGTTNNDGTICNGTSVVREVEVMVEKIFTVPLYYRIAHGGM